MHYYVLHKTQLTELEGLILCFLPDNPHTPFVTWRKKAGQEEKYWGHYYDDLGAAIRDYRDRGGVIKNV